MSETHKIKLQCYSMSELAKLYNVCRDTMRKWLEPFAQEIGERNGRFYNINQVKIILDKLGWPDDEADERR